jgi:hypothetical protein
MKTNYIKSLKISKKLKYQQKFFVKHSASPKMLKRLFFGWTAQSPPGVSKNFLNNNLVNIIF